MSEKFDWPPYSQEHRKDLVSWILWTLYYYGPVQDESGRAVKALREVVIEHGGPKADQAWYAHAVKDLLENKYRKGGFLRKAAKAKRTFTLELKISPADHFDAFPPDPYPEAEVEPEPVELPDSAAVAAADAKAAAFREAAREPEVVDEDDEVGEPVTPNVERLVATPRSDELVPFEVDQEPVGAHLNGNPASNLLMAAQIINEAVVQIASSGSPSIPEVLAMANELHELRGQLAQRDVQINRVRFELEAKYGGEMQDLQRVIRGQADQIQQLRGLLSQPA